MILTLEIQGMFSGSSPSKREPSELVRYTNVWGHDTNDRYAKAVTFDHVAEALTREIASKLSEGEVLSSKRLVVRMEGQWKTNEQEINGKIERSREFLANKFNIIDGPALEGERLRKDALRALTRAEELRKSGNLALAYETTALFVANFAGVPLDLDQFLADVAADDVRFGASSTNTEADPESLAAAHFARADGVLPKIAAETPTPKEEPLEAKVEEPNPEPSSPEEVLDFDTADGVVEHDVDFIAPQPTEDSREEDAINVEAPVETPAQAQAPEKDVLDDAPVNTQEAQPTRSPPPVHGAFRPQPSVRPTQTPMSSRPPAANPSAARPVVPPQGGVPGASKQFVSPPITKTPPQPQARPAPTGQAASDEHASSKAPPPVPAFLKPR